MSVYPIIIVDDAIEDIAVSIKFYNQRVSGLSFEFEEEVFSLFEVIKSNPDLFPIKFASIHEAPLKRFP